MYCTYYINYVIKPYVIIIAGIVCRVTIVYCRCSSALGVLFALGRILAQHIQKLHSVVVPEAWLVHFATGESRLNYL